MNLVSRLITVAVVLFATGTLARADIKIGSVLSVTGPASFLGDHFTDFD